MYYDLLGYTRKVFFPSISAPSFSHVHTMSNHIIQMLMSVLFYRTYMTPASFTPPPYTATAVTASLSSVSKTQGRNQHVVFH